MSMEKMQVIYEGKVYYRYEDVLKNMFGVDKRGVLQPEKLEGIPGKWIEQENAQKACRFNKVRPMAVFNYEWEREKKLEASCKKMLPLYKNVDMYYQDKMFEKLAEDAEHEVSETLRKLMGRINACKEARAFIDSMNDTLEKLQSDLRIRQYISINKQHQLDQRLILTGNGTFIELYWNDLEDLENTFFLPALEDFTSFSKRANVEHNKGFPEKFNPESLYVFEIDHPDSCIEISLCSEEDPIDYEQPFPNVVLEVMNSHNDIDSMEYGWKIYVFYNQNGRINFFLTESEYEEFTLQRINQQFNVSQDCPYFITYEEMLRLEKPFQEMKTCH